MVGETVKGVVVVVSVDCAQDMKDINPSPVIKTNILFNMNPPE